MTRAVAVLAATLAVGCSSDPGLKPDPVEVSGVVLLPNGQPARDVVLNLFPTSSDQNMGGAQLKGDGKFTAKVVPGTYTFAFEGKGPGLNAVPKKYHQNEAAHTFEVPAAGGSGMTIRLQN